MKKKTITPIKNAHGDQDESKEQEAIDRLRASKELYIDEVRGLGREAGREYVLDSADYEELQRLKRWHDKLGTAFWAEVENSSFEQVAAVMRNDDNLKNRLPAFLHDRHGDDIKDPNFVSAFVDGALSQFQELSKQL